jgi:hypothetical protein
LIEVKVDAFYMGHSRRAFADRPLLGAKRPFAKYRVTPPLDHLSHPQVGLPQTEEDFLPAGRQGGGAEGHCFVAVLEFAWLKIRGLGQVGMLRERPVRPDGAP